MEKHLNSVEEKSKTESVKPEIALQCAKAAILLSTLKRLCPNSTQSRPLSVAVHDDDGGEVWELKQELVKEKLKNRKMKTWGLAELFLHISILLSLWTLGLFIAFGFR